MKHSRLGKPALRHPSIRVQLIRCFLAPAANIPITLKMPEQGPAQKPYASDNRKPLNCMAQEFSTSGAHKQMIVKCKCPNRVRSRPEKRVGRQPHDMPTTSPNTQFCRGRSGRGDEFSDFPTRHGWFKREPIRNRCKVRCVTRASRPQWKFTRRSYLWRNAEN